MPVRFQPYSFGIADSAIATAGGVPLDALHYDVDAICRAYDAIAPVAQRLGVPPPRPRLAGFSYCHVSTLGAPVVFAKGSEPNVSPILHRPEDIDALREPTDPLACGVVPERLASLERLLERRPDAHRGIGHAYEGPLTSASLLMGPDFFVLPHSDPERAHRLIAFCVESSLRYAHAINAHFGKPETPGPAGIPDDFAGIFPPELFAEFVVPYWDRMYEGLGATERHLHSELLRVGHLPFLAGLGINVYDPSADQYLTPEILREHCPVPFTGRIQSWHIRDKSPQDLQAMYRQIAACEPVNISFYMSFPQEEEKIRALLATARELAGE
ncbi:MAG: hypothetical protein GWP08_12060 [Nitrospiraceae bacterium]|nr:hypothetical protein [Nitrospiraceae bacterium]